VEDKRKDLKNTHQKEIVEGIITALNESNPSFYYLSTIEIAAEVKKHIHQKGNLLHEDFELVKDLTRRDIQILLSLH